MKRFFTLLLPCLLCSLTGFAQQYGDTTNEIAEAERKATHALTTFTANSNTGNYDVIYHKLELSVDPTIYFIAGTITTDYIAKENMSAITFDLSSQLTVSSVVQNGNPLTFTQNINNELVITLPGIQAAGTQATIAVTYSGTPPTEASSFVVAKHGDSPILWTLSEPFGAKDWWPCKQDLNDKIDSIDVFITAPAEFICVSNGIEQSNAGTGTVTKTTHYRHNYPIPAYLVAIAVSNYGVYTQQAGTAPNEFPIVNYLYPESQAQNEQNLAATLPIMAFYEELFETYPFHLEKYGHAQCGFSGGMEHTTVSFMGSFGRNLIAHELAHQWFGDKVTCGSWKDIWLNEGFATYLSGLVIEHLDGTNAFRDWRASNINSITFKPDGAVYLTDTDTLSSARIFDSRLTYNKGAMVLHMLRRKLGEDKFFQGLKNYLADNQLAYAYAKTPQLQAHLEAASGLDLNAFFNDWIYNQGYPIYTITAENTEAGKVHVVINQKQSHSSVSYFEMPVPIRLLGANGAIQDIVLENTANSQEFTVDVPFEVIEMVYNTDNDIISTGSTAKVFSEDPATYFSPYLTPNPTGSVLTANLPDGVAPREALFFNAIGQKVGESYGDSVWDVSQFANGVYFIALETTKGRTDLKFIKN